MTLPKFHGIEYSEAFLGKALGLVKHFGFAGVPTPTRDFLDFTIQHKLCTQEQIDQAQQKYLQDYFSN